MLEQTKELPSGLYTVPLMVGDLQGFGSTQTVTVRICRCRNGVCLAQQNSTSLGVWGILAMLLGLALLLLLCESPLGYYGHSYYLCRPDRLVSKQIIR